MSRKRPASFGQALTGGSGDVNQQYNWFSIDFAGTTTTSGVPKSASYAFPMPLTSDRDHVPVVELLKTSVVIDKFGSLAADIEADVTGDKYFVFRLSQGGADDPSDTTVISTPSQRTFYNWQLVSGAAVSSIANSLHVGGAGNAQIASDIDYTDSNGHGIILYGNTISATGMIHGVTLTRTVRFAFCVSWRVKFVTLQDYIQGSAAIGGALSGSVQAGTT